ncbi:hypothetical protein VTO42DRAFT_4551 [Malbranchea cinnamomea]
MAATSTSHPPKRRSRSGCAECRARHRKCDERKPSCSNCLKNGKQCDYTVRLSWGGRPFSKSRFGQCLRDPGLVRVPVKTAESQRAFVYSSAPRQVPSTKVVVAAAAAVAEDHPSPKPQGSQGSLDDELKRAAMALSAVLNNHAETTQRDGAEDLPLEQMIAITSADRLLRNPHELSWLSSSQRHLLDHFVSCTTVSLSCHQIIQRDFCAVLLPMALKTSHLLAALLACAATHRLSLGLPQSQTQLDFLKCVSLQQLRAVLAQPGRPVTEAVIATTLTLCTADIISDGRKPGSWRLHLQGSAAIIGEHLQHIRDSSEELTSSESLLWRWYLSIEALSLLCGNLAISPSPSSRISLQMRRMINDNEIDDLAGFSTSLIPVFSDINLLAMESIQQQSPSPSHSPWPSPPSQPSVQPYPSPPPPDIVDLDSTAREAAAAAGAGVSNDLIRSRCYRLISDVRSMLASHEPRFRPLVDASLSSLHKLDFVTLDETFHHVALLHLYRRVLNLPSSSVLVQSSVKAIIDRLADMHFVHGPCPGVAVLQPVFTAGCEACEPCERDGIRSLLQQLGRRYGSSVGNIRRFLEALWALRDERGDKEGRMRWDEVMVEMGWDLLVW